MQLMSVSWWQVKRSFSSIAEWIFVNLDDSSVFLESIISCWLHDNIIKMNITSAREDFNEVLIQFYLYEQMGSSTLNLIYFSSCCWCVAESLRKYLNLHWDEIVRVSVNQSKIGIIIESKFVDCHYQFPSLFVKALISACYDQVGGGGRGRGGHSCDGADGVTQWQHGSETHSLSRAANILIPFPDWAELTKHHH